tara:strand:+ start:752 stop:1012 length:261 start_codon:yes stop_codon:yes gene_type:complete
MVRFMGKTLLILFLTIIIGCSKHDNCLVCTTETYNKENGVWVLISDTTYIDNCNESRVNHDTKTTSVSTSTLGSVEIKEEKVCEIR